jgi:hypothetical protein
MFNSYGVGTTAAVGLFAVIALAFAVSVDSNRSSDAARNEFMSASVSKPDQSNSQGRRVARKASGSCQPKLHHCRNRGHSEGRRVFREGSIQPAQIVGAGSDAF